MEDQEKYKTMFGNKFAVGNKGGQPPYYNSVDEIENKINDYFESITIKLDKDGTIIEGEFPTVTGMALFLGFSDKKSIYDYKEKKEFLHSIKRALTVIEYYHEQRLFSKSPTGSIFALKNFGWKDRTEQEVTHKGNSLVFNNISEKYDIDKDGNSTEI